MDEVRYMQIEFWAENKLEVVGLGQNATPRHASGDTTSHAIEVTPCAASRGIDETMTSSTAAHHQSMCGEQAV
jgi:hypothetical protein